MPSRKRGPSLPPYRVLRDSREKQGWTFPPGETCVGTDEATLRTGDYTLVGHEERFVIERKGSMGEFAVNLFQKRFDRELDRLDKFEHAYLMLEFNMEQVVSFPVNSGIPAGRWKMLRITPQVLMKRLHEVQLAHPRLHVLFVGARGREVTSSLFKRIVEKYGR